MSAYTINLLFSQKLNGRTCKKLQIYAGSEELCRYGLVLRT